MQTIFIEENITHPQIIELCEFINSCSSLSLEFRRCTITDFDYDELMNALSKNGKSLFSFIFNIKMIDDENRFKRFVKMLSYCPNLINLQIHGNNVKDDMFDQLYSTLRENCFNLTSLDLGDNRLTNKSITKLTTLIIPDEKRKGLEELFLSANPAITTAGWTELLFAISFNSRIQRLALDYNVLDNTIIAMLSMVIASSRTLTHLDLESCNLTQYAGQLLLNLFTNYPVKLQEICLDRNNSISESTRTLINECFALKSRENSIANEPPPLVLFSSRSSKHDDDLITSTVRSQQNEPINTSIKKSSLKELPKSLAKIETKSVGFVPNKGRNNTNSAEVKHSKKQEEEDADELLPIDITPYGTIGPRLHVHRLYT